MHGVLKNIKVIGTIVNANIKLRQGQPPKVIGKWLSKEFQLLGPTYVKIGQLISSRGDVFGQEFSNAFSDLRDQVKPISQQDSNARIDTLITSFPMMFKNIDKSPIAAASIGQVHKAYGTDGQRFILKLRRPDIETIIKTDLAFLKTIIDIMIKYGTQHASHMSILVKDIERFLVEEIDFWQEAQNIDAFYTIYVKTKANTGVIVPRVYMNMSSSDIIVMEFIEGITIDDYNTVDRKQFAKKLMNCFIFQLLDKGIVHGDPHKGNIRVSNEGDIILLDFGNVIRIDKSERYIFKELVYMLVIGNKYGILTLLKQLGAEVIDQDAMMEYLDKYLVYVRTIDISVFQTIKDPANKVPLRLSGKLVQLIRVYGILEGICKEIDPSFSYFDLIDDQAPNLLMDDDFLQYKMQLDMRNLEQRFQTSIYKFFGV